MDAEKWRLALARAFPRDRAVKLLVLLGLCGIALIFLSGLLSGKETAQSRAPEPAGTAAEEYREQLERGLSRVVRAITGEEDPTVLVTLEDGGRSVYAADEKTDSREAGEETQTRRELSHVLLKDSGGAQCGLTVTELRPKVRGVVIVCGSAGSPAVREKLTEAVRTALGLSSAPVCVTDAG